MIQSPRETDPMLRRFERNQVIAGVCIALAAAAVSRRLDVVLGVICGAALMVFSYRAIKGGVDLLMPGSTGAQRAPATSHTRRRAALAARFVGRYALLALAAYVMLAYLQAHPVGLLLGVASPVAAVAVEALHFVRASSRPGHSRQP
jgi:hypothetical protein